MNIKILNIEFHNEDISNSSDAVIMLLLIILISIFLYTNLIY